MIAEKHERSSRLLKVIPNMRGEGIYVIVEQDTEKGNRATLLTKDGKILEERINEIVMGTR